MTPEQITKWAVKVGMNPVMEWGYTRFASPAQLQAFAQLVRNEVLEECAKYCETRFSDGAADIADGIRGLKK